jgi:hypothetical protein
MAMLADLVELARRGRHPQAPPHRRGRGRHHRGGDRPGNSWRPPRPATASCWHWPTSTRAAREALGRDQLAQPRAAGARAALQARLTTRRSAVQAGTDAQRQLHALVVAAPDPLRSRLGGLTTRQLVTAGGRLRQRAAWDAETAATAASLRALARASESWMPRSPSTPGPSPPWSGPGDRSCSPLRGGPDRLAAIVLCAWSHPGRRRTDAALAMLGGAAPIPASSGQTVRVRRNRSGDRHLNQALHLIVLTRLRYDPATRADAQRRRAEARPTAKSDAAWSARSPASSTDSSRPTRPLTLHRSVQRNDQRALSPPVLVATQIYLLAALSMVQRVS